jgi:hypothetical protein
MGSILYTNQQRCLGSTIIDAGCPIHPHKLQILHRHADSGMEEEYGPGRIPRQHYCCDQQHPVRRSWVVVPQVVRFADVFPAHVLSCKRRFILLNSRGEKNGSHHSSRRSVFLCIDDGSVVEHGAFRPTLGSAGLDSNVDNGGFLLFEPRFHRELRTSHSKLAVSEQNQYLRLSESGHGRRQSGTCQPRDCRWLGRSCFVDECAMARLASLLPLFAAGFADDALSAQSDY